MWRKRQSCINLCNLELSYIILFRLQNRALAVGCCELFILSSSAALTPIKTISKLYWVANSECKLVHSRFDAGKFQIGDFTLSQLPALVALLIHWEICDQHRNRSPDKHQVLTARLIRLCHIVLLTLTVKSLTCCLTNPVSQHCALLINLSTRCWMLYRAHTLLVIRCCENFAPIQFAPLSTVYLSI